LNKVKNDFINRKSSNYNSEKLLDNAMAKLNGQDRRSFFIDILPNGIRENFLKNVIFILIITSKSFAFCNINVIKRIDNPF
jgi:hypothetical protein